MRRHFARAHCHGQHPLHQGPSMMAPTLQKAHGAQARDTTRMAANLNGCVRTHSLSASVAIAGLPCSGPILRTRTSAINHAAKLVSVVIESTVRRFLVSFGLGRFWMLFEIPLDQFFVCCDIKLFAHDAPQCLSGDSANDFR